MNDSSAWTGTIRSHGFVTDILIAAPMGLLLIALGVTALVGHSSAVTIVVAISVLLFAGMILASCAFSLWGTCFVSVEAASWTVTRSLWRWHRTVRFPSGSVRGVSIYKPAMASIFPGSSGSYIQVSLDRVTRPLLIGEGLHSSREELEPIRALIEREAHLS
ncbi:MAG TPA: hypothetical protein VGL17_05690 [Gemmatimonadaceae bacterium]